MSAGAGPRGVDAMGWMDAVSALEGLRVDHGTYDLRLDGAGNVRGTGVIKGEAVAGRDAVVFALSPGVAVTHVEVDGVAATAEVVGEGIWSIGASLAPGFRHHVRVRYEGRLDVAFMRDEAGHAWYEMQFMTRWRPVFGLDRLEKSRATLILPATFTAASAFGLVQEDRTGREVRYVWDTGEAAGADFSLVVGEGLQADGEAGPVHLRALGPRAAPPCPQAVLAAAGAALRAYRAAWGPCPYPRLTLACLPHSACGNCSREGLVLFGQLRADPMTDPSAFRLVAHEVSHMWWGLGVRFDEARSLGYEEALANYCDERLARDRFGEGAFREHLCSVLLPHARVAEAAAGVSLRDCRYDTPESGRLRWAKGACAMLLLEAAIGRPGIDAALAGLMTECGGRQAEPADVRRAFVDAGGERARRLWDDYFDGVAPLPAGHAAYTG